MPESFVLRALVGGIGIALVTGPLGCFVVWRRMAYFGSSIAHGALLGVALGLLFGVGLTPAVLAVSVVLAGLLVVLQRQRLLATDTLLGILAHAALAFGLIALALMEGVRVDLMAYLFGDVLSIGWVDIAWIYGGGALALAALATVWTPLLAATLNEELARAEGQPVGRARIVLMLLIALVVAIAMKIVGVLLIVSLLIIPAATARGFARTPEAMAVLAAGVGVLAVLGGIAASMAWDWPAGPAIVAAATVLFVVSLAVGAGRRVVERG
ncbi:MAG TPA: metal ABC transporter permease [Alphaproteobacteria bacterium]|nr:metal ABC transporter permease [Alphaproteobacteria bacterium]